MELSLREAKARLSELVRAARDGERAIITRHGRPAAGGRPGATLRAALSGLNFQRARTKYIPPRPRMPGTSPGA